MKALYTYFNPHTALQQQCLDTKAYNKNKGLAIFRLQEHTKCLLDSAKLTRINPKYSVVQLNEAQLELLRKNEFENCNVYIRPHSNSLQQDGLTA